ncbi:unnamed protein product [Adineta steineri]|uniref:Uncharacterized protein n=1 Tax=Adineta steineri TaxID=433720 RepID=A0A815WVX9_9BILA|nr:unnamed protein product [Adineta steineri]CAF1660221.1 unnamed protein product [Adineta steineri]
MSIPNSTTDQPNMEIEDQGDFEEHLNESRTQVQVDGRWKMPRMRPWNRFQNPFGGDPLFETVMNGGGSAAACDTYASSGDAGGIAASGGDAGDIAASGGGSIVAADAEANGAVVHIIHFI